MSYYAIDFGTSNSLISYIDNNGNSKLIPIDHDGDVILKSIIFTPSQREWYFGKEAIEERENNDGEGRFFRSIKKFLAEPNYKGTEVHGKLVSIEFLVSKILGHMKIKADRYVGENVSRVVLGRPARYSLDDSNDKLAETRMEKAAKLAGFETIIFCPEPLAAGLNFSSINEKSKAINVLIADFGGGTSDFTILKVHDKDYSPDDVLGMSGLFVAGDALDGQMMRDFISKHFGSQIEYQIPFNDNVLRFPKKMMLTLCSPAHISILREKETWELLKEIQSYSISDEYKRLIEQLFTLVEEQLAYPVYREIENTKIELSSKNCACYTFKQSSINIEEVISEESYRESISPTIEKIKNSMLMAFEHSSLELSDIDKVFITGGTGQSPYIQEMLRNIFGAEKISDGEVFQSVINGLSEYAKLQL